jgi:uncharacterized protein (TIRG00374 family)
MKKNLGVILKILVSLSLIAILVYTIDLQKVLHYFQTFNLAYLPLIILFIILNYIISSVRWKSLLIHQNSQGVSVWYLTSLYFIGSFFNNFMPTSIGGDVFKVYTLGKKLNNVSDAFSATFMERFTGLISLVFIAIFGLIGVVLTGSVDESSIFKYLVLSIFGLFAFFGLGTFVGIKLLDILRKKISKFNKIYDSLMVYKGQYRVLVVAFFTSFIVQFLAIFTQYFIFVGLGQSVDVFKALFILCKYSQKLNNK